MAFPQSTLVALCLFYFSTLACAQTVINGQIFTYALAIVDAPAIGTTLHAGSNMNLAIDISGDGKLPSWQTASVPGSSLSTRYDSLEVYLVSSQTSTNFTVSASGLLTQEPGSTVKHLDWPIPSCITAGNYNVTIYETSHINGDAFFSITPLSISIENANPSGQACTTSTNQLQTQPQPDCHPSANPWTKNTITSSSQSSSGFKTVKSSSFYSIPAGIITVTLGASGLIWPSGTTHYSSNPSASAPPTVTVTAQPPTETVTVIVVSPEIIQLTTTVSGKPETVTSTVYSSSTMTTLMADSGSGFLPVNSSKSRLSKSWLACFVALWNAILFALVWISL